MLLDKFFLKYKRGVKLTSPQKKLPSKSLALLGLRKRSALTLFTDTRLVTARLIKLVKHTAIFFTRAAEHMGISNLTGKRLTCVKQSAVSDHRLERNCSIDFDHFDILSSDADKFRLLVKEGLLIKRDHPQLKKTIEVFPLELFD